MDYDRKMDYPSNGVSILACLRPAFLDEESYIRRLFLSEDRDDYSWEVQGPFIFSDVLKCAFVNFSVDIFELYFQFR